MSSIVWIIYSRPRIRGKNHENKSYDKTRFEKFKGRGNKNKPQADDLQNQRNANTNVDDIIESVGDLLVMLDAEMNKPHVNVRGGAPLVFGECY